MNKSNDHWIKSSWSISIGTAIFSLLLTIAYDYLRDKPLLTTIWTILMWISNLIKSILSLDIKFWWIIVIIIILVIVILIISFFNKSSNRDSIKPDFYNYRDEKFKKWSWTWSWDWDSYRKAWHISDLKARCPKCDTPMIDNSSLHTLCFDCPRCEYVARDNECEEPYKIEQIILDNIERKRKEKKIIL
jgi:hypothetical protein